MNLDQDLYSLDKKLLIKAKQTIKKRTLNALASNLKSTRYLKLKNSQMGKDIKHAFKTSRYRTILTPKRLNKKILTILNNTILPEKVIDELKAIRKKMPYTYRHILITAILSTKLSLDKQLKNGYDPEKMARFGLVHDIGKSRLPSQILNKSTPLTRYEHKLLKKHPLIGYILLRYYCGKEHYLFDYACYEHHERLDGSGYPRKIKKINKYSKVIAVVDVFDALLSSRPYRRIAYSLRAALDFLQDNAKKGKLNKRIVYLLTSYARKSKPPLKRLKLSKKKRDNPPASNAYGKVS